MRVPRLWIVLVVLLIPVAALADDHKADLFGGGQVEEGSVLKVVRVTFGRTLGVIDKDWSVVGDVSFSIGGKHGDLDVSRRTFMGGVRWAVPVTDDDRHVFGFQAVAGGVNATVDDDANDAESRRLGDGTKFAAAVGFLWEYVPLRAADGSGLALRAQVDWVLRSGSAEDFARLSLGIGWRWGYRQ